MRKIKYILSTILSVFLVMLSIVVGGKVVNAEDVSVFNADNGTNDTVVAKNTNFISDSILQIQAKGASATYGTAYALGDYELGLWFSNNTNATKGFLFTNTSSTESIELTVAFGAFNITTAVAVSSYFTTDTLNTVTTSTTDSVTLTTNLDAGTSSYLVTTGRQTSLFEVSYSTGSVYYDVTINDNGVETVKSVKSGEKLDALDDMFGYAFAGYYLDADCTTPFDYANETIEADMELYVKWTSNGYFTNDYNLTTACVSPLATSMGTSSSITSDIKLNHIYTVLTGCKGYTSNGGAIATNGGVTTTQKGLKIDLTGASTGVLVVNIACGGNTARNAKLINSSSTEIIASSGDAEWADGSTDWYTARTITYPIASSGVYYLGGSNGMRIFSVEFVSSTASQATVAIEAQQSTDGTAVRFITTLTGVDAIDVTSWNVTLTYNGGSEVTTSSFTTLYLAVVNTKEAADGTYYLVFTVSEIPSEANGKAITAAMTVTFEDGSSITTLVKEETILQIV